MGAFAEEREALWGEGEELVDITGVVAQEMVVERVVIFCVSGGVLGVQWCR